MAAPSPHAEAARAAAASLAADFVDAPPSEPVSPFKPRRAQDPRQRPVIQPNDAMQRGSDAFDLAFNNAISNPGLVREKPSYRMSESEFAQYRDRVFGGEPVEAADANTGKPASKLQALSDEQISALESKLRDERDRRAVAEYADVLAAGEAELDDLSDLTAADDQSFGDAFAAYTDTDMAAYYNQAEEGEA